MAEAGSTTAEGRAAMAEAGSTTAEGRAAMAEPGPADTGDAPPG
jgi:hypothetical protein